MRFKVVLDVARVLIIEVYREYGMKFQEAVEELESKLVDPTDPRTKPRAPDNEASMAVLQAMMGGSDFGGPKG